MVVRSGSGGAEPHQCPLCGARNTCLFHRDQRREYWRCPDCALVHVPARYWLSAADERAEYDRHDNRDTPGYRRFLARALEALASRQPPPARCLEFGCGPGPVLATMLREQGYAVALYDPFYAPDTRVLAQRYAAITCTEVVEHVQSPCAVWERLEACLAPGGTLVVMTKRVRDQQAFARWHYIGDPTHITYYSDATLAWVAQRYGWELALTGDDVAVFSRPVAGPGSPASRAGDRR